MIGLSRELELQMLKEHSNYYYTVPSQEQNAFLHGIKVGRKEIIVELEKICEGNYTNNEDFIDELQKLIRRDV